MNKQTNNLEKATKIAKVVKANTKIPMNLEEEMVPWRGCKKLERQRVRKLGKRVMSLMTKVLTSKRSPCSHLKPGCVVCKHGLGLMLTQ